MFAVDTKLYNPRRGTLLCARLMNAGHLYNI